jgi:hypothetical protein
MAKSINFRVIVALFAVLASAPLAVAQTPAPGYFSTAIVGGETSLVPFGGNTPALQSIGGNAVGGLGILRQTTPGIAGGGIFIGSSRGTPSTAAWSALQSGDGLGQIIFSGDNGSGMANGVIMRAIAAGAFSGTSNPGTLNIMTVGIGHTTPALALSITSEKNVIAGQGAAIPTNSTNGYFYLPAMAGAPNGTPANVNGSIPAVYDTVNNVVCFYSIAWQCPRTVLKTTATFYIDGTSGNDANPCTAMAKCRTLSHARKYVQDHFAVTSDVQVIFDVVGDTSHVFDSPLNAQGPILGQFGTGGEKWLLHSGVTISVGGNPNGAIGAFYGANFILSAPEGGVTLSATGSTGVCVAAGGGTISIQSSITYSNCSAATAYCGVGGTLYFDYGMTVSGNQETMLWPSASGCIIQVSGTVNVVGIPHYSNAFAWAYFGGAIGSEGVTFVGTATGKRYKAERLGIVSTSYQYPGDEAGVTLTGGIYTGP